MASSCSSCTQDESLIEWQNCEFRRLCKIFAAEPTIHPEFLFDFGSSKKAGPELFESLRKKMVTSFLRSLILGMSVTAALLRKHGVLVFDEERIDEALDQLEGKIK